MSDSGRRSTDAIRDLRTHKAPFVTVSALAVYWGYHANTVRYWIRTGRMQAMRADRDFRVRTSDALAYEARLFRQQQKPQLATPRNGTS
jgi:transposase-like protein